MNDGKTFIGKDILRLITVAMYDDPLTLYREYIQNAVDSIDSAVYGGFKKDDAVISIVMNHSERRIAISDNGKGIKKNKFVDSMTAIGRSEKTTDRLRGLWGIGRLVGLAYCRNVVFTTKAKGERTVSRIEWDGQKFRQMLSDPTKKWQLHQAIQHISKITVTTEKAGAPAFFEVQLNGIIRHGNDALFNEKKVRDYIGQVAPVPFHPDAPSREKIDNFLSPYVDLSGYHIVLNNEPDPVYRPHRKEFFQSISRQDNFSDVEFVNIKDRKDETVAAGWFLHHSYFGALKNSPEMRGIRARSGNMQIGNERVFIDIFPETRFNSWAVGEVHILAPNIRPNGQRNGWEDTPAYRDLKNKLVVCVGQTIAKKCRTNSANRNKILMFENKLQNIELRLDIVEQNILPPKKSEAIIKQIEKDMEINQMDIYMPSHSLQKRIIKRLQKIKTNGHAGFFGNISKPQQKIVKDVAGVIYDNAPDSKIAKKLISEIGAYMKNNHQ